VTRSVLELSELWWTIVCPDWLRSAAIRIAEFVVGEVVHHRCPDVSAVSVVGCWRLLLSSPVVAAANLVNPETAEVKERAMTTTEDMALAADVDAACCAVRCLPDFTCI
jgi:hypothetical protein